MRIKADFEQTVLVILMLNVLYMYYIDHKLIVLIIRMLQFARVGLEDWSVVGFGC